MPLLMLKDMPRYECLLKGTVRYPSLNVAAFEAFLHLLRTNDAVFASKTEFLATQGLSQGRFTVLMLLDGISGSLTPAELADAAGVSRATMTGLIDTLVKDGLVLREGDKTDRRAVCVTLTIKGQKRIAKVLPEYCRWVSKIMDPLSEAQRKQLVRLLQSILAGVSLDRSVQPKTKRSKRKA